MMTLKQQIEEVRAGARKPTCFNDLLELQQKLDDLLAPRQKRERTIPDICMSAIAEVVEFNEETKESHKTWAKHEYNAEKEKEEAIDILFFFCQLINKLEIDDAKKIATERMHKTIEFRKNAPIHIKHIFSLIEGFSLCCFGTFCDEVSNVLHSCEHISTISYYLASLLASLGMDFSEVLERYWSKWNENLDRIGKGKDGKGWL